MSHIFDIHFNGGVPFKVEIFENDGKIIIYKINDDDVDQNGNYVYDTFKTINKYEHVFVPHDSVYGYDGNTILIEITKNKYMYIGKNIYVFKTNEEITDYKSPMGNSDVPYPFAISKNYYYLLLEKIYYKKELAKEQDPYGVYYGHIKKVQEIQEKDIYAFDIVEKFK